MKPIGRSQEIEPLEDFRAGGGVARDFLHHLLGVVPVVRQEQGIREPDLADVVQQACQLYAFGFTGIQADFRRDHPGDPPDALGVAFGVGVAGRQRLGHGRHGGDGVAPDFLVDFLELLDQLREVELAGLELHHHEPHRLGDGAHRLFHVRPGEVHDVAGVAPPGDIGDDLDESVQLPQCRPRGMKDQVHPHVEWLDLAAEGRKAVGTAVL